MRRKVTSIRLSSEEIAALKKKAEVCGMRYTRWCREVALGYTPRCTADVHTVQQLRMLGHNLNQLTKLGHLGQLGPEAPEDLRQIRAALDRLVEALR